ncbi:quinone oxidoreductase family protein [Edaphobacter aggregans]|uniref:quinone oxidoreductase family protein n=1 Tax=Edaphobacter aggregans TaxID=570835 RepID=UPI00055410B5|nr:zinc-binding alcohol dehydrogenase family protein [Edaphobacter aggregans]
MNAAVVESFSAPPRYTTFADPVAGDGEQLVTVTAAGLHPLVRALASGSHYGSAGELPFVVGVDGVGRLADGSRVYFGSARAPFGTFSELAVTRQDLAFPLPDGLDDTIAAATANPGMSSWVALNARAKFVSGESVLILGATGSAGQLAIQIAKRLGARHVVAVGRHVDTNALKTLGADSAISLDQEHDALVAALRKEWSDTGVDVVLDYLWGQPAEAVLEAIARKGLRQSAPRVRYIQIGESAGSTTIALPAATLRGSGLEILGSGFGSASTAEIQRSIQEFFAASVQQPFEVKIRPAPLREVESLWSAGDRARLVFQP